MAPCANGCSTKSPSRFWPKATALAALAAVLLLLFGAIPEAFAQGKRGFSFGNRTMGMPSGARMPAGRMPKAGQLPKSPMMAGSFSNRRTAGPKATATGNTGKVASKYPNSPRGTKGPKHPQETKYPKGSTVPQRGQVSQTSEEPGQGRRPLSVHP